MKTVYHTTLTRIEENTRKSLAENMAILFREGTPEDIGAHRHGETVGDLLAVGAMILRDRTFPITAVGTVATQNLHELGHITVRFDSAGQAKFPDSVHVADPIPSDIVIGSELTIQA